MADQENGSDLPTLSGPGGSGAREPSRPFPEIEGYEVLGPLGEGGMGIVWRAVQLSTRRPVALKLHRAGAFASPKALLRFEREVELAARLEHPHIARVYESGLRQGVYYYAMELVEGVHLDQYVAEQGLSQRQVLPLLRTVCEAIQHAHQRGVIHRDLKPSNILVTADGQPHVVDFGLAKTLLEDDARAAVSVEGEVAGTPAYMSPEQAAAKLNQIDTRTDVYSLGVILYRLLTNEFPHDLSGTRLEVLRRIAEEEVRRPRQFTKVVDKELEALLLKALAHDPEGRYPTAHALAEDLRRYAAYEPIEARPMGSFGRLRRWCKRKPVVAGLAAAVVVALVAGTGISTYFGLVARRHAAEATANAAREAEARKQETTQRLEAERQTRMANAQRLVAQAGNALDKHPERSLRLVMHALETTLSHGEPRVPEAEQTLRDALARVGGRPLQGHEDVVVCVAISPDGRWLVTGSNDKTARLWDLTAKDPAAAPTVLRGHEKPIGCVTISPDGRWLVTGSEDKTARLWDLTAKDPAAAPIILCGHEGGIQGVGISPDGRWAVAMSTGQRPEDTTIWLWDLTAKDPAAAPIVLRGHEGPISCGAISLDGRWLLTGSSDRTARLWDLTAKDPAAAPIVLRGHEGPISCGAISLDGRWLVTGSSDKTARLWHLRLDELMDLARRTLGRPLADEEMNSAGLAPRPGGG